MKCFCRRENDSQYSAGYKYVKNEVEFIDMQADIDNNFNGSIAIKILPVFSTGLSLDL